MVLYRLIFDAERLFGVINEAIRYSIVVGSKLDTEISLKRSTSDL